MTDRSSQYQKLRLDTEWWFEHLFEEEGELIRQADWAGLIRVRKANLANDPENPDLRLLMAVAYCRAGAHDRALSLLGRLHRDRPGDELVQDYALESLFASGRSEDEFPWIVRPLVARIEEPYLARLHELLLAEARPWPLFDLMLSTNACAFLTFGEEELLDAVEADPRFEVRQDGGCLGDVTTVAARDELGAAAGVRRPLSAPARGAATAIDAPIA